MRFLALLTFLLLFFSGHKIKAQKLSYYGGSKQVNDSVKTLLESIEEPTLNNRGNFFRAMRDYGKDSEQAKNMLQKMIADDSVNAAKVVNLYHRYGWPKESQLGEIAVGQAFLQIQHADFNTQLKFLPIMKKAARQGELNKNNLALLHDRILTNQRKKQLYGTQYGVKLNPDGSKETLIWPIKSFPNMVTINKRRAKMGYEKISLPRKEYDPDAKVKDFR